MAAYPPGGPASYGYGPPSGHAPVSMGGPPGPPAPGAPGVLAELGARLLPGERLLYFRCVTPATLALWIFGLLFLPILVGLVFIALALRGSKPKAVVMTSRRLAVIHGPGKVEEYFYEHFADVAVRRVQVRASGGGLVGALVVAGVSAAADAVADRRAKTDPSYWSRAAAVVLVGHDGRRVEVPSVAGTIQDIGPKLVYCIPLRQAEQFPPMDPADAERIYETAVRKQKSTNRGCGVGVIAFAALAVVGSIGFYVYDERRREERMREYDEYETRRLLDAARKAEETEPPPPPPKGCASERACDAPDGDPKQLLAAVQKAGRADKLFVQPRAEKCSGAPCSFVLLKKAGKVALRTVIYDLRENGKDKTGQPVAYWVGKDRIIAVSPKGATSLDELERGLLPSLAGKPLSSPSAVAKAVSASEWRADDELRKLKKRPAAVDGMFLYFFDASKGTDRAHVEVYAFEELAKGKPMGAAVRIEGRVVTVVSAPGSTSNDAAVAFLDKVAAGG